MRSRVVLSVLTLLLALLPGPGAALAHGLAHHEAAEHHAEHHTADTHADVEPEAEAPDDLGAHGHPALPELTAARTGGQDLVSEGSADVGQLEHLSLLAAARRPAARAATRGLLTPHDGLTRSPPRTRAPPSV